MSTNHDYLLSLDTNDTEPLVELTVFGKPAPQGSKKHIGNGRLVETSKDLKPWRQNVKKEAERFTKEHGWLGPIEEEVLIDVTFFFDHTAASKKRKDIFHHKTPDLDKLQRAIGDALAPTPVPLSATKEVVGPAAKALLREQLKEEAKRWTILSDDSLIVAWHSRKVYTDSFEGALDKAGAIIRVYPIASLGFDEGFIN